MTLDIRIAQRVTYARALIKNATCEINIGSQFSAGLAILAAQDGVEMLLRAIAEALNVQISENAAFDQVIAKIDAYCAREDKQIPRRLFLTSLNKARVGFKHAGNLPDIKDAQNLLRNASQFCNEATSIFFGELFESFSLVNLVNHERARDFLKTAESQLLSSDYVRVFDNVSSAFACIIGPTGLARKDGRVPQKALKLSFQNLRDPFGETASNAAALFSEVAQEINEMHTDITQLRLQMRLLSLGLNAIDLTRFQQLMPLNSLLKNGRLTGPTRIWAHEQKTIEQDARFVLEFATDSIITAELKGWSASEYV